MTPTRVLIYAGGVLRSHDQTSNQARARVLISDPCLFGLAEIWTVAHIILSARFEPSSCWSLLRNYQ